VKKIIIKTVLIALSSLTFYSPITYANTVSWYITQGILARNKGNYKTAIDFYNKAQQINPNIDLIYLNRGVAKVKIKDFQGALKDYNKAIEINPQFAEAYMNRGALKGAAFDDYSGSINDLNKALSINPQLADAYRGRGFAQLLIGEKEKACVDFKKASSFNNKTLDLFEKYCK
jgi:tetratricopeptide (TPR) repeat protein